MIIKSSFDPKIKWVLPEGDVPYKPNEVPEGTEHTLLVQEAEKLWHFIEGADNQTPKNEKRTNVYSDVRGFAQRRSRSFDHAKDKKLTSKI